MQSDRDETFHPVTDFTVEALKTVLMMPACAVVHVLRTCALTCVWFDLPGRGEKFILDLSMFWLDSEGNRQGWKMSKGPPGYTTAPVSKEQRNKAYSRVYISWFSSASPTGNNPTRRRWKKKSAQILTSLVRQRAQTRSPASIREPSLQQLTAEIQTGLSSLWFLTSLDTSWQLNTKVRQIFTLREQLS